MYALLSAGGMGGRNGLTLREYGDHSDRQLLALLEIEFDKEGRLVTEAQRRGASGEPDAAMRELPAPADLGLDDDRLARCLRLAPAAGTGFLTMYFSVWRGRGATAEQAEERWRARCAWWARQGVDPGEN